MRNLLPSLLAVGIVCLHPGAARGEELRLSNAVVEGRVVEETSRFVRIETVSGVLAVPVNVITRRIPGPSRLERYAQERGDGEALTPARHLELAAWCRSVDLHSAARHHLDAALAADPKNPDALRAAGYVLLGDVWLKAGLPAPEPPADNEQRALIDRLLTGWHKCIRSIREHDFSDAADDHAFARGRGRLLALREPLIIPSACRVLGIGGDRTRVVLAEMLGSYGEDAATLNLLVTALLDTSPEVREAAATQLTRRSDRRIGLFLRKALRCESETILRRAAESLARLADDSAVDDLITVLPTTGVLGRPIDANALLDELQIIFSQPTLVPCGSEPFEHPASVAIPSFRQRIAAIQEQDEAPTGAFRSYVQDALIEITGENYGFDMDAWRDWATRRASGDASAP